MIHCQDSDGDPADGRSPNQVGSIPAKMARPFVPSRVEKLRELLGSRVEPGDVRPLVAVVMQAGKGEIAEHGGPSVLVGNDMINWKWDGRVERLGHVAIFAGMAGALSHPFS